MQHCAQQSHQSLSHRMVISTPFGILSYLLLWFVPRGWMSETVSVLWFLTAACLFESLMTVSCSQAKSLPFPVHFIGKGSACCLKIKMLHKKNMIYSLPNNTYSIDCMASEVMIPRLSPPFSFLILHILDSSSHILVPPTRYAGKRGKKDEEEGVRVTGI